MIDWGIIDEKIKDYMETQQGCNRARRIVIYTSSHRQVTDVLRECEKRGFVWASGKKATSILPEGFIEAGVGLDFDIVFEFSPQSCGSPYMTYREWDMGEDKMDELRMIFDYEFNTQDTHNVDVRCVFS